MTTPLMIEVGDADETVFYHQGIEPYNISRRARKNVVLLVYGGEDHGLRKKADRVDYGSWPCGTVGSAAAGDAGVPGVFERSGAGERFVGIAGGRFVVQSEGCSVPECRNWQTNRTQNPAHFTGRVGSSPTSGTTYNQSFSDLPPG